MMNNDDGVGVGEIYISMEEEGVGVGNIRCMLFYGGD